jgi:phosphatidylserine/phosphatidylglycerophosphate/cardiolipin synthase-like enzyme
MSHVPFVESGSYPVRPGNVVRPLIDGTPVFRRICEAVESAQHSVWICAAFATRDFRMPDGRGSFFDVLDRAQARGLDVRVIFWRPNTLEGNATAFRGTALDRELLDARNARWRARWDRSHEAYCQHQKSWLIDAGLESEVAFVGGVNMTLRGDSVPGHPGPGQRHDAYVEIVGPAATDVHHNFVQRWNEASERTVDDGHWGHTGDDQLSFPTKISPPRGHAPAQIQRTVHAGRYSDSTATPGGRSFDIAGGERTILEQYLRAIDAAERTLYIENQSVPIVMVAERLEAALKRGVDINLLVPAEVEPYVRLARQRGERQALFAQLGVLDRYPNFRLAGIQGHTAAGEPYGIYVHDKVMVVDDVWATIGSCNLHAFSLEGSTEMNCSFDDPEVARKLRCDLMAEHLGCDVEALDDRAAMALFREIADANRYRHDTGARDWQGLVFRLDAATYGE